MTFRSWSAILFEGHLLYFSDQALTAVSARAACAADNVLKYFSIRYLSSHLVQEISMQRVQSLLPKMMAWRSSILGDLLVRDS